MGQDNYPTTLEQNPQNHSSTKTHGMYKSSNSKEHNSSSDKEVIKKLQYTQKEMNIESRVSELVPGTDGKVNPDVICYNFNKAGYYAPQCPMATVKTKVTNNIVGVKVSHNGESYTLKYGNLLVGLNAISSKNTSVIKETSILIVQYSKP